ncbi:Proteoglycan 4 [Eumeta japonica]|uniref:Proteoglycan 4 n=1 Tax=Eumeta variegata TaxID=151549 RepID=A0A4C1T2F2_EUMVA|nr:Proteoglycan 4 [Eumeta japonica]
MIYRAESVQRPRNNKAIQRRIARVATQRFVSARALMRVNTKIVLAACRLSVCCVFGLETPLQLQGRERSRQTRDRERFSIARVWMITYLGELSSYFWLDEVPPAQIDLISGRRRRRTGPGGEGPRGLCGRDARSRTRLPLLVRHRRRGGPSQRVVAAARAGLIGTNEPGVGGYAFHSKEWTAADEVDAQAVYLRLFFYHKHTEGCVYGVCWCAGGAGAGGAGAGGAGAGACGGGRTRLRSQCNPGPTLGSDPGPALGSDPGPALGSDPGPALGSDPGPALGSDPGPALGSDPGPALGSDPGPALGSDPGPALGSDHGPALGSDPGRTPGSDPGRTLGSDPGRTLGSDPDPTLGSDPGRTLGSDPGRTLGSDPYPTLGSDPGCVNIYGVIHCGVLNTGIKRNYNRKSDRADFIVMPQPKARVMETSRAGRRRPPAAIDLGSFRQLSSPGRIEKG